MHDSVLQCAKNPNDGNRESNDEKRVALISHERFVLVFVLVVALNSAIWNIHIRLHCLIIKAFSGLDRINKMRWGFLL